MSRSPRDEARRIALFSPLPPMPSGIADYTADLLPLLPDSWEVDVYLPAEPASDGLTSTGEAGPGRRGRVRPEAHWESVRRDRPYDLNVYQVGNNRLHESVLGRVVAHPGLLVLHDPVLHPSRLEAAVEEGRPGGYRAMVAAARPELGATLGEVVGSGLGGKTIDWTFPMCEDLVRASRLTVVHGELTAAWLRAVTDSPPEAIDTVVHWRSVPSTPDEEVAETRRALGGEAGVPLVGTFGFIGPAHGVELLLDVLGELASRRDFRLAIVGGVDPSLELQRRALEAGIGDRVRVSGRLPAPEFAAAMAAVDLAVNLRYPTARASSGTLQQLLQLGTPVVVHDLVHLRDIPDDAVLRVPPGPRSRERSVLLERLDGWLADPDLGAAASDRAREWARATITPEAMAEGYRRAVARALRRVPGA